MLLADLVDVGLKYRLGDYVVIRQPPRFIPFKWPVNTSIRYLINSLEPLAGVPIEMIRISRNHRGELTLRTRRINADNI